MLDAHPVADLYRMQQTWETGLGRKMRYNVAAAHLSQQTCLGGIFHSGVSEGGWPTTQSTLRASTLVY